MAPKPPSIQQQILDVVGRGIGRQRTEIDAVIAELRQQIARTAPIMHQGKWDATRQYVCGDAVGWRGCWWIAVSRTQAGDEPGSAAVWSLAAQRGERGKRGEQGLRGDPATTEFAALERRISEIEKKLGDAA